jgi:hypothetical protein
MQVQLRLTTNEVDYKEAPVQKENLRRKEDERLNNDLEIDKRSFQEQLTANEMKLEEALAYNASLQQKVGQFR